jgi:hypothetical protein
MVLGNYDGLHFIRTSFGKTLHSGMVLQQKNLKNGSILISSILPFRKTGSKVLKDLFFSQNCMFFKSLLFYIEDFPLG